MDIKGLTKEQKEALLNSLLSDETATGDLSVEFAPTVKTNTGGGIFISGPGAGSMNLSDNEAASFMLNAVEVARRIAAHVVDTNAAGIGKLRKGETPAIVAKRVATIKAAAKKVLADLDAADGK